MISKQRILVFDIETAPILAYVWDLRVEHIAPNQIKTDKYVLAWSAKWLGEPASSVVYHDLRNVKTPGDDVALLKPLWKLLDEADIVVTQNGKDFDSPMVNARFILHGMPPPSPYRHLDTYRIAKHAARFTSNKLEHLTETLCVKYKKLSHKKYPGFSLWLECLAGNRDAWDEMKRYNVHDVLSTEELYFKLRAWAPKNAPKAVEVTDQDRECATCGHVAQMRVGKLRRAKTYSYRQNSCVSCGAWQAGEKVKSGASR